MVKKTFISILLLSTFLHAHAGLNKNPQNYLSPGNIPLDKEAMIYSVSASFNSISLESIKIDKPKKLSMGKYHTISKRDKYALSAQNKEGKEVFLVGLGDPFYIHVDHIGYEDADIFGGYIDQDFEIAIPLSMKISYLVLLSQNEFGFKEIKKIKVN